MQLHGNEARLLRYDLGSRLESVQEARFVGVIEREEVDKHGWRGRDAELALKRDLSSSGLNLRSCGFWSTMVVLLSIVKLKLA
jgi:hypothetical protein